MKKLLKQIKNRFLPRNKCKLCWAPCGHFYSPIPDISEIKNNEHRIFENNEHLAGIDLNKDEQISLLHEFKTFYSEHPFADTKKDGVRYHFNNGYYEHMDALVLYCMLRKFKPKRVFEVGSGFSSCVMLDTNQIFFNNEIDFVFIEPHPKRLLNNVNPADNFTLLELMVQNTDIEKFDLLEKGDILFIDSSHVSKIGSDVNFLYFEVIPRLKSGVIVHIHDIFYPFEYPKTWVYEGRAWNEAYLLRAMLTNSKSLKIKFFNSYLGIKFLHEIQENMPLGLKNTGGSIWLEKI